MIHRLAGLAARLRRLPISAAACSPCQTTVVALPALTEANSRRVSYASLAASLGSTGASSSRGLAVAGMLSCGVAMIAAGYGHTDARAIAKAERKGGNDRPSAGDGKQSVFEVASASLSSFLRDQGLVEEVMGDDIGDGKNEPPLPSVSKPSSFLGKIKDAVDQAIDSATDASSVRAEDDSSSPNSVSVLSLTKSIASVLSGNGDDTTSERAVRTLIEKARQNVGGKADDVTERHSYAEMLSIFSELMSSLDKTFGDLDFSRPLDPTSLWYFLELEDERKNPSWKRRTHRFHRGVDVRMVNELWDEVHLADLAYSDTIDDLRDGLDQARKKWELVYFEPFSEPGRPSHFIALRKGQSKWNSTLDIVFAVRGTKDAKDLITDSLMHPVEYRGGLAHDGIVKSGKYLCDKHTELLKDLVKLSGKKKINLSMIGHSLGAASAAVAGIELNEIEEFDVKVTCFGCPPILSRDLSEKYKGIVKTVINDADCIPRMSGATIANVAMAIMEYDYTPYARRDAEQVLNELQFNASTLFTKSDVTRAMDFIDSAIDDYIRPALTPNNIAKRVEPVLFPPGLCIHFYRDGRAISGSLAPCTFFSEIDVSRTMLDDHLIKNGYRRLFLDLMRHYHDDDNFTFYAGDVD